MAPRTTSKVSTAENTADKTTNVEQTSTPKAKSIHANKPPVSPALKKPRASAKTLPEPAPTVSQSLAKKIPLDKLNAVRPNKKGIDGKKKPHPGFQKGQPRPLGAGPNDTTVRTTAVGKAKIEARKAIAMFVDNNAGRLQEWLDSVAAGVKDKTGKFIIQPDPVKAFTMFHSVIEYHVPKLARQEVVGPNGGAIQIANMDLKNLSAEELQVMEVLLTKAATKPESTPESE